MTGGSTFQDFFTQTMGEFGTVPKRGLIYVSMAGALSAITDLVQWGAGAKFSEWNYALLAVAILPWLAAAYATTMTMVEKPSSVAGFVKFTAVTILTFVPILSSLAVLVYASGAGAHDGLTISTVIALFLAGLLLVAFLPAWPIAQAISTRLVSPMRIVKATKGYRWSLILVLFAASSVNKLVPSMSSATNVGEAIALALCGAVVAAATLVLTASIAVTAWKFAARRDASLAPTMSVSF
ncbi:hypothetical protein [Sphingobium sp. CAP-1]|uniref:hypothetical protein n=1 Tax=Sphingobium sp. CAP-1 TaxID=2676077 RepID=UPI0012BB2F0A|nr:hypothetical protein [Sphingobium sp. CAP-1]QGP78109.1 hypothetical protein GL174_03170 [Sphingobium sp. CAP-1]